MKVLLVLAGIWWVTALTFATPARTVWDGVYTAEQAARGRADYTKSCASCHAVDLRGSSTAPSLVEDSFAFLFGELTVGELYSRICKLMPADRPGSLSVQSCRDITAFLLQSNSFPTGDNELDGDQAVMEQILIATKRPEKQERR
jgi:cytochrome c553